MTSSLAIALIVFVGMSLIATVIGIILRPRIHHDHYGEPHGDVPKVPYGR